MFRLWDDMRLELGQAARKRHAVYEDDNWVRFYRLSVLAGKRVFDLSQRIMILERNRRELLHNVGYKHDGDSVLTKDDSPSHSPLPVAFSTCPCP
jgi:hypothetical protein